MANFKELTKRIKGISNAQQITKTMEMVAAARLRKTETQLREACEYGKKIDELVGKLSASSTDLLKNPLFEKRESKNVFLVIIASDKGLCGSYNSAIIRAAEKFLQEHETPEKIKLVIIGKKAFTYFKNRKFEIDRTCFDLNGNIVMPTINEMTEYLTDSYLQGKVDEVYLLYTAYRTATLYVPTLTKFLNVEAEAILGKTTGDEEEIEYIFEPSLQGLLDKLLPIYIKNKMLLSVSEAITSENSSRMIAMKNATDNADDLVKEITKVRNRARQAAITTEILEIIAGAEAIKSKDQ